MIPMRDTIVVRYKNSVINKFRSSASFLKIDNKFK